MATTTKDVQNERLRQAAWTLRQYATLMRKRGHHPAEVDYADKIDGLAKDVDDAAELLKLESGSPPAERSVG